MMYEPISSQLPPIGGNSSSRFFDCSGKSIREIWYHRCDTLAVPKDFRAFFGGITFR
ncbi:hypothetical protein [Emergencia sp. 1XD21-10]|uniref:hypothetical protein n=1 Tax=Emergencia sp. 1XD21-10 TaxID=2304569 RepID=UPI00137B2378|nr:hypothetical protein [Emergencia sp. 1XD21-10]